MYILSIQQRHHLCHLDFSYIRRYFECGMSIVGRLAVVGNVVDVRDEFVDEFACLDIIRISHKR